MIAHRPDTVTNAAPALALSLFGPFAAAVHGQPLLKIRSQKEQWLLALLALRAQAPLERSWLAATLWPEATDEAALYNLRRTLCLLRDALGPEAGRLLSPTPRTLRLDLAGADCDVAAFDAAARRSDEASLAEAAALYSGPLLLGCLEEWALPEREARERAVLGALETLADAAQRRGDWPTAAARLRRALAIDPLRETALRALLQTLAAQGCHAAATEAYRAFRRRIRDELNAELDPETVGFYRRIQAENRQHALAQPLASLPAVARPTPHLPTPLTPLVGRDREVASVTASLDRSRLVTLTGPGGVGKTRLALAVAHALHEEFGDGAWFADLAPLADPTLLTAALVTTLGLRGSPGRNPTEALFEFLRHKRLLLILDNCEHLAAPCAHLALELLRECPSLCILATSRESLRVPGEVAWPVPSLPPAEAARLFVERAAQSNPSFRSTPAGEESIAHICHRLDGIPLAIEMAAARTRAMSLPQIAARLDDAFRLLSEPGGDLLPRHQTLRATLDWSYDLLSEAEKTLLARLSVFAGGWTLEGAEAVCADPPGAAAAGDCRVKPIAPESVLDLLAGLVDKSLVVYEEQPDGTGRYRLLETVRQYARQRLQAAGEEDAVSRRQAEHCLGAAEEAEAGLTGPQQARWLDRLEAEHENLRGALAWCRTRAGLAPEADTLLMCLAGALTQFWWTRGNQREGLFFLTAALERHDRNVPEEARLRGLRGAAVLVQSLGGYAEAQRLYEEALEIARRSGDQATEADLLGCLAEAVGHLGNPEAARALLEAALLLNRKIGNRHRIASNMAFLGYLARLLGDVTAARTLLTEAVALSRELGDSLSVASHLGNLAAAIGEQGDHVQSRRLLEETLALYRSFGNKGGTAWTLSSLAHSASEQGDLTGARSLLEEALTINRQMANRAGEAWNLRSLGQTLVRLGEHADAEALLRRAFVISEEIGELAGRAWCRHSLGVAASARADHGTALGFEREALREMCRLGMKGAMTEVMEAIAGALRQTGRPTVAAETLGAADAMRQLLGVPRPASWEAAATELTDGVRRELGDDGFAAAWAAGHAMSWEQAAEYALAGEEPAP